MGIGNSSFSHVEISGSNFSMICTWPQTNVTEGRLPGLNAMKTNVVLVIMLPSALNSERIGANVGKLFLKDGYFSVILS